MCVVHRIWPPGLGRHSCGDVHGRAEVLIPPEERGAMVHAGADNGEILPVGDQGVERGQRVGGDERVREHEERAVADEGLQMPQRLGGGPDQFRRSRRRDRPPPVRRACPSARYNPRCRRSRRSLRCSGPRSFDHLAGEKGHRARGPHRASPERPDRRRVRISASAHSHPGPRCSQAAHRAAPDSRPANISCDRSTPRRRECPRAGLPRAAWMR